MWGRVDSLATMGLDAALAAAFWSGLMALAMVGCRQPARRIVLARVALVGLLALGPLVVLAPLPRTAAREALRQFAPPQATSPAPEADRPASSLDSFSMAVAPGPGLRIPVGSSGAWSARALVLAYGLGVALSLGWLALGGAAATWMVHRSETPQPSTAQIYEGLPYRGRLLRPRLRVSPHACRPMLVGVLRPTILIPPGMERACVAERLRLSLCHELAHAERFDGLGAILAGLARAVWFFLPQVGWIGRQLRLDQEFLADRRAAERLGTTTTSYAGSLVELAGAPEAKDSTIEPRRPAAGIGGNSALALRVLMLVHCPFPVERRAPRWWRRLVPLAALCGALLASTVSVRDVGVTPGAAARAETSLRLDRLTVIGDPSPNGAARCLLPIRLPAAFELRYEIEARPLDLPLYAIAGYHVAPVPRPAGDSASAFPEAAWLQVCIRRDAGGSVRAWVDDREASIRRQQGPGTNRLSVQVPAGRAARIRNLSLSW